MMAKGQSLTEYLMIGALALIVTIGALGMLGEVLKERFGTMLTTRTQPEPTITAVAESSLQPGDIALPLATGPKAASMAESLLGQGDIKKAILVTGANGTTDQLADAILSRAKEMLAAGKINESQFNRLADLANQGHRIASIERLIEQAANAAGQSPETFSQTKLLFEGKYYTPEKLGNLIGTSLDGAGTDNPEMERFQALYNQAIADGALSDPTFNSQINALTANIVNISNGVETATDDKTNIGKQLANAIASTTTDKNSTTICTLGGNHENNKKFCLQEP